MSGNNVNSNSPREADLLVIGGGIAGLTAGARASMENKTVIVVEISNTLGGNGQFAGYIWSAPNREVMAEWNPEGREALRNNVIDRFSSAVEFIKELGVDVGPAQKQLAYGEGHPFDTNQYIQACKNQIGSTGYFYMGATARRLLTGQHGSVTGAEIELSDGSIIEISSPATLIATGGFQGNAELLADRVHPDAAKMQLRSARQSQGAGLKLATEVGAATGTHNAGFYGHLIPSEVTFRDSGDFVDLSLYYSEHALLFNLNGERFTDESLADHLTTMELLEQPEARGLLIADERVYQNHIIKPYVAGAPSTDKFDLAMQRGGRAGLAEKLDELEDLPEEWGYDGAKIAAAIHDYNATVEAGQDPSPGRAMHAAPLIEPPYYVIETVPAITYPFHGILVDEYARALTEQGEAIPGLYVSGGDMGGLYHRAYAGGIAAATTFSLAAIEHISRIFV
jgi:succinate dehydrogenase/fumarate reductase flavoprotein subunit